MAVEMIESRGFDDSVAMADVLLGLSSTAKMFAKSKSTPVIYVLGPDGTQFSHAALKSERLTDGSIVYHIVLEA